MDAVVPKLSSTSFRNGEFGLPIYLLVGFLTLLLVIASNAALTAQPSNLLCHKPSPYHLWSLLSPFFSLVISHPSLCLQTPIPLFLPSLLPKIPHKLAHSENSLETCSRIQTAFSSGFPLGTNNVQLPTPYLTIESSVVLSPFVDIGPNPIQQLQATPKYWSYVHILWLLGWAYPHGSGPTLVTDPMSLQ